LDTIDNIMALADEYADEKQISARFSSGGFYTKMCAQMEVINKRAALRAALRAELAQHARQESDGYMRGFNDGMKEAPTGECWIRAIDEAMVGAHIGVANIGDDYGTAKEKLNSLICWSVEVDRELSKPAQQAEQGWVSLNDGLPQPHQMVLVARGKFVTTGSYSQAFGWEWAELDGEDDDSVATHWMAIPAAPKEIK